MNKKKFWRIKMIIQKVEFLIKFEDRAYKRKVENGQRIWFIRDIMSGRWEKITGRRDENAMKRIEKTFETEYRKQNKLGNIVNI